MSYRFDWRDVLCSDMEIPVKPGSYGLIKGSLYCWKGTGNQFDFCFPLSQIMVMI